MVIYSAGAKTIELYIGQFVHLVGGERMGLNVVDLGDRYFSQLHISFIRVFDNLVYDQGNKKILNSYYSVVLICSYEYLQM